MNAKQLYLAWLRTTAPTVYMQAIKRATGRNRNLGGLTDDLLSSALAPNLMHSFLGDDTLDEINVTAQAMPDSSALDIGPINTDFSNAFDASSVSAPTPVAIDSGTATGLTSSSSGGSTFANILTAVTAIGAGVLQASNQSKLIQLNTTRAQQGLPPINANGQIVGPTRLAPASGAIASFERAISGATSGGMLPILLLLGVGGIFFLKKRSA